MRSDWTDQILAEFDERRKPGSSLGKRKASSSPQIDDDESGLQRAVKKLIRQAQLEMDSPNHSIGSSHNTPSSNSGPTQVSPQPKTGRELDMRIFSDTPRDRPVFDAYPMPPTMSVPDYNTSNGHASGNLPGIVVGGEGPDGGLNSEANLQIPSQNQPRQTSPFTFPVDPNTFPPYDSCTYGPPQPPHLDPAVESILASYFPQPSQTMSSQGEAGSAAVPQVPDDFLSKVFNFGWEGGVANISNNKNDNGGNGDASDGMQGGGGGAMGGDDPVGSSVGQQMMNQGGGMDANDNYMEQVMGGGGFDGWNSHGWMA